MIRVSKPKPRKKLHETLGRQQIIIRVPFTFSSNTYRKPPNRIPYITKSRTLTKMLVRASRPGFLRERARGKESDHNPHREPRGWGDRVYGPVQRIFAEGEPGTSDPEGHFPSPEPKI